MPIHYKLKVNTYFGGKGSEGTYQKIINQIPPHDIKVIGFAGHCAITRYMTPGGITFLIDKDQRIIETWNKCEIINPMGIIVPINDSFMNWSRKIEHLQKCYKIFVYLDPPYPLDSRKCNREIYKYEMTDDEHVELLNKAKLFKCPTAISTYPNKIYKDMLLGWRLIEFESSTRHGMAKEWLFMNYDQPTELQDYNYIGNDFRERERIKKKQKSLTRKIEQLTPLERAMLQRELNL